MNVTTSIKPESILANCTLFKPVDAEHINHSVIQRFGSPLQSIYIDQCNVDISGVSYENPLILPIVNGQLELVQCAVIQDAQPVAIFPDGLAKGFASYGHFDHAQPVILTYNLEAFFKVAQTGYAVVLVVLPHLCNKTQTELKAFDFEQIQFVIHQLSKAGFKHLYLPVRAEHIKLEPFKKLEQNTAVRLLNQTVQYEKNALHTDLSKDDDADEVQAFIDEAIEKLPKKNVFPKGHLTKPFKYGDGVFHLLESGLYYIEQTKDDEYKRYVSSPIKVLAQTRDTTNNAWWRLLEWHDADGVKQLKPCLWSYSSQMVSNYVKL